MEQFKPSVVSLVPSLTETLIEASVKVVGRTRYCIYPEQKVQNIPVVGGTKALKLDDIKKLNPDFVIIDQQENTKEMALQLADADLKLLITNVTSFKTVISALENLGEKLQSEKLKEFAARYQLLSSVNPTTFLQKIILKGNYQQLLADQESAGFEYVIWKNPFMVIGPETFIFDNLKLIGIEPQHSQKYPTISDSKLMKAKCLFSSEPYPFAKKYEELCARGFKGIVVDAEKLSWFGIRNLLFLESTQQ